MDTLYAILLLYGAVMFLVLGALMRLEMRLPSRDQSVGTVWCGAIVWPITILIAIGYGIAGSDK